MDTRMNDKDSLILAVVSRLGDPQFCENLRNFLDREEREAKAKDATERARNAFLDDCKAGKRGDEMLALKFIAKHKSKYYSEFQWVPSEFQTLEKLGYVTCQFGPEIPGSHPACRSRTILVTYLGKQAAEMLKDVGDNTLTNP